MTQHRGIPYTSLGYVDHFKRQGADWELIIPCVVGRVGSLCVPREVCLLFGRLEDGGLRPQPIVAKLLPLFTVRSLLALSSMRLWELAEALAKEGV